MHESRLTSFISALSLAVAAMFAASPSCAEPDPWVDIRNALFASRAIAEDSAFAIYAPEQAEDAAIVPIAIHMPATTANEARTLTLIIDRNPAPVAATFHFGEAFRGRPEI